MHALASRSVSMTSDDKIPRETAKELRALAHDLSNALETILQASYLIGQSEISEHSRRWIEMIDAASQDAIRINRQLREILRSRS